MAQDNSYYTEILGVKKPTDIEIALYILRHMNNYLLCSQSYKDQEFETGLMVKLAENAIKTMTNPYAKKLLLDKIDEFY